MTRIPCVVAHCVFLSVLAAAANAFLQVRDTIRTLSVLSESKNVFSFEVSYDGRTCKVPIEEGETILAAMERAGVSHELTLPDLPSDCRSGNCMTCSGRHACGSQESSLRRGADGLSPTVSRDLASKGHVLLCSSYITGDGLKLDIGENDQAWNDMYRQRLEDHCTRQLGLEAVAKAMRIRSESNVEEWTQETEAMLEKSGEQ